MVKLEVDKIAAMMKRADSIRNISVIAHVDHGKSTLTDSLISKAGIIAEARSGEARFMDTRADEQARSITIKSTAVSLFYQKDPTEEQKEKLAEAKSDEDIAKYTPPSFLINLIDSPGHVDFSSEVTAALRVTDGALVVIEASSGVCVQTETVLRQALGERIKPVLFVNKLDMMMLSSAVDLEESYKKMYGHIAEINTLISSFTDGSMGDVQVDPRHSTVGFGSGLHAWGFTLSTFAKMYSLKFGVEMKDFIQGLWGHNFWHSKKKVWYGEARPESLKDKKGRDIAVPEKLMGNHGFVTYVLQPIYAMISTCMNGKTEQYLKLTQKLGLNGPKLTKELVAKGMSGEKLNKELYKLTMRTWLPAGDALLEMICDHLPSPVVAQKYRCEKLYSGDLNDKVAQSIRDCNAKGPLMMYVSKMVPSSEKGKFYAFGRVFSGTLGKVWKADSDGVLQDQPCNDINIFGPDYKPGEKKDLFEKTHFQRCLLMMGRYVENIDACPAGNIAGISGVDKYIQKTATISDTMEAAPLKTMKFSVSAVVRVAVAAKNGSDIPKLVDGLKRLAKSDPLVQITAGAANGEHVIAGAGELHLEICLKDLQEQYIKGASITISEPVVSFAETVAASGDTILKKSANKHNRIFMYAEPLGDDLSCAIEDGDVSPDEETKTTARTLADKYGWDITDARKIWSFGCAPDARANLLVDVTKGVQYLNEIKDSVVGGFIQATAEGVICKEVMRGIRFNITDVTLHADAIHRGAGQIMPPVKDVMRGCQINSGPRLVEPVYAVNIEVPTQVISGVYSTLAQRRGTVDEQQERGLGSVEIRASLPVMESFGFTGLLRANTGGQAFPQMSFSHWQELNGDPITDEDSKAREVMMAVRERKGEKMEVPNYADYHDRL